MTLPDQSLTKSSLQWHSNAQNINEQHTNHKNIVPTPICPKKDFKKKVVFRIVQRIVQANFPLNRYLKPRLKSNSPPKKRIVHCWNRIVQPNFLLNWYHFNGRKSHFRFHNNNNINNKFHLFFALFFKINYQTFFNIFFFYCYQNEHRSAYKNSHR